MKNTLNLGHVVGSDGAPGPAGADGKGPYEIAVEEGYTGTESEFYAALVALKDSPFLPLSGGEMSGDISLSGNSIFLGTQNFAEIKEMSKRIGITIEIGGPGTEFYSGGGIGNVPEPIDEKDVANKRYVDQNAGVPIGCILIWSGSEQSIPAGWRLCDGLEGTPDLRDRFVVCAGGNTHSVGDTGGEATHKLTTSELPSHSHGSGSLSASSAGSHTHSYSYQVGESAYDGFTGTGNRNIESMYSTSGTTGSGGSHSHSVSGSTSATGSGTAHNNLPPYYALCYIMKVS